MVALLLVLALLLLPAGAQAQLLTGSLSTGIPSGGAVGGSCTTTNALLKRAGDQTIGCSAVIDASGALSGITTQSMSGQLTSTLATGSAPFVVASTTRVSNLNVAAAALADAATVLATPRTINGTSFDGSANITVTAAAGTLTGTTLNATVVSSSLTSVGVLTSLTTSGDLIASSASPVKLSLRDTGLSTGLTSIADTTAWASLQENTATEGGAKLYGLSSAAGRNPLQLLGLFGSTDPTDATPGVWIIAGKRSGTSFAPLGATETVLQVASGPTPTPLLTVLGSGFTGIGTVSPATMLHVAETITASPRGVMSAQYNTGTDGARLHMRKARGTETAPVVIVTGDNLGRLVASGYDGSSYLEMASIILGTEGTIASGRVPTILTFQTATDASPSVLTTRLTINSAGLAAFTGAVTATTFNGLTVTTSTGTLTVPNGVTLTGPAASGTAATLAGSEALTNKTYNGLTLTSTTGTFTLTNGKTLSVSNSLTLAGTDGTTLTFQGTDTYVGRATTDTLTNKTLTSPVIANIAPGADFTITQNSVAAVTSVNSGALVNTIYATAGDVAFNTTSTRVAGTSNFPSGTHGLTISGTTLAGYIEGITQQADASGNALLRIAGADKNATGDTLAVLIRLGLSGATANNRGGKLSIFTKANNGAATERVTVENDGSVGIGQTSPTFKLDVTGTGRWQSLTAASGTPNSLCINSATKEITENAALTCTVSSMRFKMNWHDQGSALGLVAALRPRVFEMKDRPGVERYGFLAEEVDRVDPRLVAYDDQQRPHSVRYEDAVSVLAKAMQELTARVEALEAR